MYGYLAITSSITWLNKTNSEHSTTSKKGFIFKSSVEQLTITSLQLTKQLLMTRWRFCHVLMSKMDSTFAQYRILSVDNSEIGYLITLSISSPNFKVARTNSFIASNLTIICFSWSVIVTVLNARRKFDSKYVKNSSAISWIFEGVCGAIKLSRPNKNDTYIEWLIWKSHQFSWSSPPS